MKVATEPHLPYDLPGLVRQLTNLHREVATQLNLLSEGYLQAATNADVAAPTAGSYSVGDFVRNSTPTELGTAGSKYLVLGWACTVAGTPGTFLPCRVLTGN